MNIKEMHLDEEELQCLIDKLILEIEDLRFERDAYKTVAEQWEKDYDEVVRKCKPLEVFYHTHVSNATEPDMTCKDCRKD